MVAAAPCAIRVRSRRCWSECIRVSMTRGRTIIDNMGGDDDIRTHNTRRKARSRSRKGSKPPTTQSPITRPCFSSFFPPCGGTCRSAWTMPPRNLFTQTGRIL
jgi:hypothetical protein